MAQFPGVSMSFDDPESIVPTRFHYPADYTQEQIDAVNAAAQTFNWAPRPVPNPAGLKQALNNSDLISDPVKVQLTPYLVLLDSYILDPVGTKEAWQRTKRVLDVSDQDAAIIEQAAANFGMNL